jgi:hypothetical protein
MSNRITANYLFETKHCEIVRSNIKRDWMDNTVDKYAYRCLPMNIVNQASWDVIAPSEITVTWSGGNNVDDLTIIQPEEPYLYAKSEFGNGILTFHTDFVLTTNDQNCIYCKGPSNMHKENIQPLEGIIETFWLPFTFTMNWKFEKPGTVTFKKGEPLFSFFPVDLNYLESFETSSISIGENYKLKQKYNTYSDSRDTHITTGLTDGENWQKYYMQGKCPFTNIKEDNHKTKVNLKDF